MGLRAASLLVLIAACAAGPRPPGASGVPRYPPRPANCGLTVLHAPQPAPTLAAWDDLGVVQMICHLDTAEPECLQRFKSEACRMGADIVYDVPKTPLRPREYVYAFRGRAAHSRAPSPPQANQPSLATPATALAPMPPKQVTSPTPAAAVTSEARDAGVPVDGATDSTSADGRVSP